MDTTHTATAVLMFIPAQAPTDRSSAEQLSRTAPSTRGAKRMLHVRYSASTAPPPTSNPRSTSDRAPQPTEAGPAPADAMPQSESLGEDGIASAPLPYASPRPLALARWRENGEA